jgi:HSP20 family protein
LGVNIPSVNIKETPKDYVLEVAAPGLERKDFNLEVINDTLTISAEKEVEKDEKQDKNGFSRREYSFNSFSRSFLLPENAKQSDIDAKYENGILKVTVPKAEETPREPKKINVS